MIRKHSLPFFLLFIICRVATVCAASDAQIEHCTLEKALQNNQMQQQSSGLQECHSDFALCENVVCKKIKDQKNAVCNCPVYHSKNLGTTTCLERHEIVKTHSVYSEYSPRNIIAKHDLKDPSALRSKLFYPLDICENTEGTLVQFADCFNVKCTLTGEKQAQCICPVLHTSKSFISEGSNCKINQKLCTLLSTDSELILNGSPTTIGLVVINEGLEMYKAHLDPTYFCPQ